MDVGEKRCLDEVIENLQKTIFIEKSKTDRSDKKIISYLRSIWMINKEFGTNYSLDYHHYHMGNLPLVD